MILCNLIYTDPCLFLNRYAASVGNEQEKMALDSEGDTSLLLGSEEVPPVLEDNAAGRSPFLLTCDHYGRTIPRILGNLGRVLPAGNEIEALEKSEAREVGVDPAVRRVRGQTHTKFTRSRGVEERHDAREDRLARRFKVLSLPTTVLLGSDGRVGAVNYGFAPGEQLRAQLDGLA